MQGSGFFVELEELANLGGWTWDLASDEISLTAGGRRILGLEAATLARQQFVALLAPDDRPREQAEADRALFEQRAYDIDYRIIWPDRSEHHVHACGVITPDAQGNGRQLAGVLVDHTEHARRAEAERQERSRLEVKVLHRQKLESLGVLAGGIAHDFNNLLVAMLGHADLLLEELEPSSPQREGVETIQQTAQRAAELTNQLLAYSGRGKFLVQPLRLDVIVSELLQLLETVISKKAELRCDFAPDLPLIAADASQVRQLVMNLITNASDALTDNPGAISLRTGVTEVDAAYLSRCHEGEGSSPGSYVFLEVADTGCGMNEAQRQLIFDPFFTTKFTGRGLGLAATLGIVRGHGGAIHVESEVDRGSTFRLLFPPLLGVADVQPPRPESRDVSLPRQLTVLVVDDERAVRSFTTTVLQRAGFEVLTACDGYEGLELLKQHGGAIALVLLDLTMPRLDGLEVLRGLRQTLPSLPVILMSGYTAEEALGRFGGDGPTDFIQKPFSVKLLRERIAAALDGAPPSAAK